MRSTATDGAAWSVCKSVRGLATTTRAPQKRLNRSRNYFDKQTRVVFDGGAYCRQSGEYDG